MHESSPVAAAQFFLFHLSDRTPVTIIVTGVRSEME